MDDILSVPCTTEALMFSTLAAQGTFGHAFFPDECDPLVDALAELCSALPESPESMELLADGISSQDHVHENDKKLDPRNVIVLSFGNL